MSLKWQSQKSFKKRLTKMKLQDWSEKKKNPNEAERNKNAGGRE
jgi:hypothetical protein